MGRSRKRRGCGYLRASAVAMLVLGLVAYLGLSAAAAVAQDRTDTTTTVTSSLNPSVFRQSVTFTATVVSVDPLMGTPTGALQFRIDGTDGTLLALNGGVARISTNFLSAGTHTVEAVYSGDAAFNASSGFLAGDQTVNKANSSTTVTTSGTPSVFGQSVTFTAQVRVVAPATGLFPDGGAVQFQVDGANLGSPIALAGPTVAISTNTLSVGSHAVVAVYSGTANFNGSTGSLAGGQTVNKAGTTSSVTSSANPSVFGQPVTFTAFVAALPPGSGFPDGTVQFTIDGSPEGKPVALSGGQASIARSDLSVGGHTFGAVYSGSAGYAGSASALVVQTVNKAATATTVTSSANPSLFHQTVTFTATVTAVAPGSGVPDGTVEFRVDGSPTGSPVTLSDGQASLSTADLPSGDHAVEAVYGGSGSFGGSTGTLTGGQTVRNPDTTTTVSSSQNPSVFGQQVTFTATVAANDPGAGNPTGTVQFSIDGDPFGSPVDLSGGEATLSIDSLSVGDHPVTAAYSGDGIFNGSSASLTQTVSKADTTTHVSSSRNPSVFGQQVTFTATVSVDGPGAGNPTGTVQFSIDGDPFGSPVALSGGKATISIDSLSVGDHPVRAAYSGNGSFKESSDVLTETVNRAGTTTTVTSSANPSVLASSVTFTATVSVDPPGAGNPTGTVQFTIDGQSAGPPVPLSGGRASMSTAGLPVGLHDVGAAYSGNATLLDSSGGVKQWVQYASGDCQGAPGHQILAPINATEPFSDFNAGSAVPAKFRVCDASGDAIGTPGVVVSFELVKRVSDSGDVQLLHEEWTASSNGDTEFKFSNHAWKFNIDTKSLDSGYTYFWSIHLNDGTSVDFRFHLKPGSSSSGANAGKH